MKFRSALTLLIFATAFFLVSCAEKLTTKTSPAVAPGAGAMLSNAVAVNTGSKLFDRRRIEVGGFHVLTDFIRPDVRARLDEEPTGDTEQGYVPPAAVTEKEYEAPQPDQQEAYNEENFDSHAEIEKVKFSWARKKFGDAIAADTTATGVIVLYADENFYDVGRLSYFVEEGRNRLADGSSIDPSRIQVVFGGYRGVPQVEMWIVGEGQAMPELKPDERDDPRDAEN